MLVSVKDECASSPCIHGSCVNAITGHVCTCDSGYTGTDCDKGMYNLCA